MQHVGVIADPAISTYTLTNNDVFFIVASDGIWEFIQSKNAVDLCKDLVQKDDATGACRELILEAAAKWNEEEGDYRDDITAIVLKLCTSAGEATDPSSVQREPHDPTKRRSSCASWTARRSSLSRSIGGTPVGGRRASAEGVGIGFDVIAGEQLRPVALQSCHVVSLPARPLVRHFRLHGSLRHNTHRRCCTFLTACCSLLCALLRRIIPQVGWSCLSTPPYFFRLL